MGPFYSIDAAESSIIFTDNYLERTKRPLMQLSFHYFFLNTRLKTSVHSFVHMHGLFMPNVTLSVFEWFFHFCCPLLPLLLPWQIFV